MKLSTYSKSELSTSLNEQYNGKEEPLKYFYHNTDLETLRKSFKEKFLSGKRCPVFEDTYLYVAYGVATYRINEGRKIKSRPKTPCTICLRPNVLPTPYAIFPFDSGAIFAKNPLHKVFASGNILSKMLKNCRLFVIKEIAFFIQWYYRDLNQYFKESPKVNHNDDNGFTFIEKSPVTSEYLTHNVHLAKLFGESITYAKANRLSTIEAIFKKGLELFPSNVECYFVSTACYQNDKSFWKQSAKNIKRRSIPIAQVNINNYIKYYDAIEKITIKYSIEEQ